MKTPEWHLPESSTALDEELFPPVELPNVPLDETDGIPLESHWHVLQIGLLLQLVSYWYRDRTDYYAAGNMFIYYCEEQARTKKYRGPDFFFVDGVNRFPIRRYWAVWKEGGRYPDVIIELLSPTTARSDRTIKKELYEKTFHTGEYVCYDPKHQRLEGWRLNDKHRYRTIKLDANGRLWIEQFQLFLGTWEGTYLGIHAVWLRFFDAQGKLVPLEGEAEAMRADAAEREVQKLKEQLASLKKRTRRGHSNGTAKS